MPRGEKPSTERELNLIADWIEQGAQDDTEQRGPIYDQDHPPRYHQSAAITSLDYSPNGKLLAVAGFQEVTLHKADGTGRVARLIGMSPRIESVRFSPNGKLLDMAGGSPAESGEVQVWSMEARELRLSLPMSYDTIRGASWSPKSELLAFGCTDNSVKVINADTGKIILSLSEQTSTVPVEITQSTAPLQPDYQRDAVPVTRI